MAVATIKPRMATTIQGIDFLSTSTAKAPSQCRYCANRFACVSIVMSAEDCKGDCALLVKSQAERISIPRPVGRQAALESPRCNYNDRSAGPGHFSAWSGRVVARG